MAAPDIMDIDEIVHNINMKAATKKIYNTSSERPSAAPSADGGSQNRSGGSNRDSVENLELVEASMSGSYFKPLVNG